MRKLIKRKRGKRYTVQIEAFVGSRNLISDSQNKFPNHYTMEANTVPTTHTFYLSFRLSSLDKSRSKLGDEMEEAITWHMGAYTPLKLTQWLRLPKSTRLIPPLCKCM